MKYIKENEIPKATTEELLLWYANARATWYGAGGHHKASVNQYYTKLYAKELKKRGVEFDTEVFGDFNGDGAW